MVDGRRRRGYLDWMRGLAVLVMIQAHVLDSWTRIADRETWQFAWAMIVAGFGAPLFLFLAGASVSLSAASKLRRTGEAAAASRAVQRRGAQIFGLAFLFRLQAWVLGWSSPRALLKVDILNIMGPAIVLAAAIWGVFRTNRARCVAFAAVTAAISLLTPIVRTTHLLDALPDPLESYFRPVRNLSHFCIFPWTGFVFAGAIVGLLIEQTHTREAESRLNWKLFAAGAALAVGSYAASYLPSPYERSEFWGGSPAFFFLRAGVMTAAIAAAYAWVAATEKNGFSPVQQLGRTSLFVYWIHVEMVYGLISSRMHKALSQPAAWLAFALFCIFMLACSIAKDRVVGWWRNRRPAAPRALAAQ